MESMNRRDAIRRLARISGGVLSASTVAGILAGCRAPGGVAWRPRALSHDQAERLEHLVEMIIPTTDTPGARAAGVPAFIDQMLADWYTVLERERFVNGLDEIDDEAWHEYGSSFVDLDTEAQTALLRELAAAAHNAGVTEAEVDAATAWTKRGSAVSIPVPEAGQPHVLSVQLRPFYCMLKELTVVGYYTSEIGAAQELQYVHTPGGYDGCMPVERLGRAWS